MSREAELQSAMALHSQGHLAQAAKIYESLLAAGQNPFEALHLLGVIAYQTGNPQQAIDLISKAIKINSKAAAAWSNLGAALQAAGRQDEALSSYDKAIELEPGYAQAHYNRANALQALGRAADAVDAHQKAIALKPDYAQAHNNLGIALRDLGRFDQAIVSHDKAIELKPDDPEAYNNRGIVLRSLGRPDDAIASYRLALERRPDFAEACNNLGVAFRDLGRFDDALASYDKAIALKPDFAEARYHKAQIELLTGNFEQGWQEQEWRRTGKPSGNRIYQKPLLTSLKEAKGKTILIHWEQGLGDTIQFCRYALLLRQAGARVLFAPQLQLKSLMASLGDGIRIVDADDPSLSFDTHIPLLSLPLLFATTVDTIPAKTPYLFGDDARIRQWRDRLGTHGFKIGICGQGKSSYVHDASRSFSTRYFEPLSHLPGIRLFNLHKADGEAQLATLPRFTEPLGGFDSGPDAFADTAAIMKSLNLVITSDTSIAHLAGALAVPVWVALASVPDWRWMLGRGDSPWYPSMRLFRQKKAGDWTGLFEDIKAALTGFMR